MPFSGPTDQPAGSLAHLGASKEAASAFIEAGATIGAATAGEGAGCAATGAAGAVAGAGAASDFTS